ncbi:MAG: hypothetical protein H6595_01030 [Flavobacteriales bacterium]|nr:hypothetical protein [Flavobacteriales bacterium]MCB9166041.1 hypothetical protein [Flavobacteriales bacterium]
MRPTEQHLVPVRPALFDAFPCPRCGATDVHAEGTFFPGIHILGRYGCASCGAKFLRDLPVGFANDHPLAIMEEDGKVIHGPEAPSWLVHPFTEHAGRISEDPVRIERIIHREVRTAIVLNTLDFLYGHVLLKIYNAQHYLDHHPEHGLVMIVPRMFAWLVPRTCAEVWVVDLGLGRSRTWYRAMDDFVQAQLGRFDTVLLGRAYSHPDFAKVDIERFTGVAPFAHAHMPDRPLHVTFVARTDRIWTTTRLSKFLYRAMGRLFGRRAAQGPFHALQERAIRRSIRRIRRKEPDATFSIVGLAPSGRSSMGVEDLRTLHMDERMEKVWCAAYARSHVVVGVHGSNMLLPTAHAGACVEILPHDREENIVQDISVRVADRRQLFLYRFLDEFAKPRDIARVVHAIHVHYAQFHRNHVGNIF